MQTKESQRRGRLKSYMACMYSLQSKPRCCLSPDKAQLARRLLSVVPPWHQPRSAHTPQARVWGVPGKSVGERLETHTFILGDGALWQPQSINAVLLARQENLYMFIFLLVQLKTGMQSFIFKGCTSQKISGMGKKNPTIKTNKKKNCACTEQWRN